MLKIAIGCDHTVLALKNEILLYLDSRGYDAADFGTFKTDRTHYPIFGKKIAEAVAYQHFDFGIIICGTGVGISNAANKTQTIRCVLTRDILGAKIARQQFDANILALGGLITSFGLTKSIIDTFLTTNYLKHNNRIISHLDTLANNTKNIDFDNELLKWDEGFYHD